MKIALAGIPRGKQSAHARTWHPLGITPCILGLAILAALAAAPDGRAADAPWHVPSATMRFTVAVPAPDPEAPDPVASVTVCLTGLPASSRHPVVYSESGTRLGCQALGTDPAERLTVLFDGRVDNPLQPSSRFLYFVDASNWGDPPDWEPRAGLRLETRTCAGPPEDFGIDAFRAAWQGAIHTNGLGLVGTVNHGHPVYPLAGLPPRELAAAESSDWLMSRYVGYLRVSSGDTNTLSRAVAVRNEALDTRQQALQTREAIQQQQRAVEAEYVKAVEVPEVAKVEPKVLFSRLMDLQREYDKLTILAYDGTDRLLRPAKAVITRFQEGTCEFFNGCRRVSHVLVDDQPILSWPLDRVLTQVRGRYVDLQKVSLSFTNAVHRLEYLHWATPSAYVAILGWKTPGTRDSVMIPADAFLPVTHASLEALAFREAGLEKPFFTWRIRTDLRCPGAADLVDMDFSVTVARPNRRYLWDFGDGLQAEGDSVSHLYFGTGRYEVTLREVPPVGAEVTGGELRHPVNVHVLWDRHETTPLRGFEERVLATDLSALSTQHLVNSYDFARRAGDARWPLKGWREAARRALAARIDSLPTALAGWVRTMADDAAEADSRHYDDARRGYAKVMEVCLPSDPLWTEAALSLASLLTDCFGEAEAALAMLDQVASNADAEQRQNRKFEVVRAQALLSAGQPAACRKVLASLTPPDDPEDGARRAIRERAELHRAQNLAGAEERDSLDQAMEIIAALLAADPRRVIAPEICLIEADIFMGRQEFTRAVTLTQRLLNLELNARDEPKILARLYHACTALGRDDEAREARGRLLSRFPGSEEAVEVQ